MFLWSSEVEQELGYVGKTATWWEMQGSLQGWEAAWAVIKVTLVGQAGAASGTLFM